jgi:beta-D-xylosidase 4
MKISASTVLRTGLLNLCLPLVVATTYPDCINGPLANTTVCDPKAPPPERAAALVKAMNISEKLVNLVEYVMSERTAKP